MVNKVNNMNENVNPSIEENLKSRTTWSRFFYMLLFAFAIWIASMVLGAVVILQFLFTLITAEPNIQLLRFGDSLSKYCYAILKFMTYNSEDHPFPFADWPAAKSEQE